MGGRINPSLSELNKGTALLCPHRHRVCPTRLAPPGFHTASERGGGRIKESNNPRGDWMCVSEK